MISRDSRPTEAARLERAAIPAAAFPDVIATTPAGRSSRCEWEGFDFTQPRTPLGAWQDSAYTAAMLQRIGRWYHQDAFPHIDAAAVSAALAVSYDMRRNRAERYKDLFGYSAGLSCVEDLGSICEPNRERCLVMCLLTIDAVKEARLRNPQKQLTILELGAGTGILTAAALLSDADSRAIAVDSCPASFHMLRQTLWDYGLEQRARPVFASYDKLAGLSAVDVVISENMNLFLHNEDQLESWLIAKRFSHERTVFVPSGLAVYLGEKREAEEMGRLTADNATENDYHFRYALSGDKGNGDAVPVCIELLNYNGTPVYAEPSIWPGRWQLGGLLSPRWRAGTSRDEALYLHLRFSRAGDRDVDSIAYIAND